MRKTVVSSVLILALFVPFTARGAVQTYSSSAPLYVPDVSTVSAMINVPDAGIVNTIEVTLTLHHPQLADVYIRLTDPNGTATTTVFNRDSGVADGIYNVTFKDSASGPPPYFLTNGQCLTNTSYQPHDPFSAYTGVAMQGNWTLEITDAAGADSVDCDCDPMNVGPPCERTLDSWSLKIDYSTNQTPVAQCHDVTVAAGSTCTATASVDDGSYDPDGDALTITQDPAGPYALGDTAVTLTATDPNGASSSCTATVTVTDDTAPAISCNALATITPPQAPISFTATASDACGSASVAVQSYDCYTFTKKGKRIDKKGSCVVSFSGATVTIADSGGVGDVIEWTVVATDANGNTSESTCQVTVVNPAGH